MEELIKTAMANETVQRASLFLFGLIASFLAKQTFGRLFGLDRKPLSALANKIIEAISRETVSGLNIDGPNRMALQSTTVGLVKKDKLLRRQLVNVVGVDMTPHLKKAELKAILKAAQKRVHTVKQDCEARGLADACRVLNLA